MPEAESILRESKDGTAGLTDAAGRVIIVSGGLQYHSLLYTRAVQSVCGRAPAAAPGDLPRRAAAATVTAGRVTEG